MQDAGINSSFLSVWKLCLCWTELISRVCSAWVIPARALELSPCLDVQRKSARTQTFAYQCPKSLGSWRGFPSHQLKAFVSVHKNFFFSLEIVQRWCQFGLWQLYLGNDDAQWSLFIDHTPLFITGLPHFFFWLHSCWGLTEINHRLTWHIKGPWHTAGEGHVSKLVS